MFAANILAFCPSINDEEKEGFVTFARGIRELRCLCYKTFFFRIDNLMKKLECFLWQALLVMSNVCE
jgi:hypothetical protein